jgi:hypothetical protein
LKKETIPEKSKKALENSIDRKKEESKEEIRQLSFQNSVLRKTRTSTKSRGNLELRPRKMKKT